MNNFVVIDSCGLRLIFKNVYEFIKICCAAASRHLIEFQSNYTIIILEIGYQNSQ